MKLKFPSKFKFEIAKQKHKKSNLVITAQFINSVDVSLGYIL